ncbi:MAG TPA: hypothetical protein VLM11_01630 [Streptosporangiaceae bacterium]|nr:hypothetical protein [Streptosporangiaceae bacterium]
MKAVRAWLAGIRPIRQSTYQRDVRVLLDTIERLTREPGEVTG